MKATNIEFRFRQFCRPDLGFSRREYSDTRALLYRAKVETLYVSAIWPYEISNTLERAERRGGFSSYELRVAIQTFESLDIRVVAPAMPNDLGRMIAAMQAHKLTIYDASVLEVARTSRRPLPTLDN